MSRPMGLLWHNGRNLVHKSDESFLGSLKPIGVLAPLGACQGQQYGTAQFQMAGCQGLAFVLGVVFLVLVDPFLGFLLPI